MEDKTIPYIVHEGIMVRMERQIRRITVALIVTVILMFVSNALWLYAWMQYDYTGETTTTRITQDGHGINTIGDGNVTEISTEDSQENKTEKVR